MTSRILLVAPRDTSFLFSERIPAELAIMQSVDRLTPLQERRADVIAAVDLTNPDDCRQVARDLYRTKPFEAAVAFHEPWLELAGEITADLGLIGEPLSAVRAARDKIETRRLGEGCGLANPRYIRLAAGTSIAVAVDEVGLPCVVKPLRGAGSEGVKVLVDRAAVTRYGQVTEDCLVEAYVEGTELSIETFSRDGRHEVLAFTDTTVTTGEARVELGHAMPANLGPSTAENVAAGVCALLTRIGHVIGPGHTEVKLSGGVPYLIETHTRYGGGRIWQMTGLVTGRYPQPALLAAHLGCEEPVVPAEAPAAAVRFIAAAPGRVTNISGEAEAARLAGVVAVEVDIEVGENVSPLSSSVDRSGYVLTVGRSATEAAEVAISALSRIRIETEPNV